MTYLYALAITGIAMVFCGEVAAENTAGTESVEPAVLEAQSLTNNEPFNPANACPYHSFADASGNQHYRFNCSSWAVCELPQSATDKCDVKHTFVWTTDYRRCEVRWATPGKEGRTEYNLWFDQINELTVYTLANPTVIRGARMRVEFDLYLMHKNTPEEARKAAGCRFDLNPSSPWYSYNKSGINPYYNAIWRRFPPAKPIPKCNRYC